MSTAGPWERTGSMGFRSVFWKTLTDLTGWKTLLLFAVPLVTLMAMVPAYFIFDAGNQTHQAATHNATNLFLLISFLWIAGFFLAFLVAANAAGFVAKEESDGTLLLLSSKPVSRRQIVLGKLAALVVRTVLLEAVLLTLVAVLFRFVLVLEDDGLVALLKAVPWIVMYSFLVIALFGAISLALSVLTRNLVAIMVIMSCLITFCFLLGPMIRSGMADTGNPYVEHHLCYIDPSYHIQNGFVLFQDQAGGSLVPQYYVDGWFGSQGIVATPGDAGSLGSSDLYYPVGAAGHVSPAISAVVMLAVALGATGLAMWAMQRKEIH
jgi:ABC-type transport system involved in multi-copper enzyme maturation permease subunit